MPKPTIAVTPKSPETHEVRDVRVRELGNGEVELVEVVFRGAPTSTRSLYRGPRVSAMADVRLYNETRLGPDRYGDSGMGSRWNGNLQRPEYD